MTFTPFYFMISQGPRAMVRAWLNDVPFYRFYGPETANRTGPAVHLLQPGENSFAIEIERADTAHQVFFELNVNHNHASPVLYFEWPRAAEHLPRARRAPFRWEARFNIEAHSFTPAWVSAPAVDIPCAGTPDLREAVRALHAAADAQDIGAYTAQMALKAREIERAYPGWQDATAADMRAGVARFFGLNPIVRPLEIDDVHFESRAGGRLAHARRTSGGHVVEAVTQDRTPDDEQGRMVLDPTFVRLDGAWRLIH